MKSGTVYAQEKLGASPWTVRHRIRMLLWEFCWTAFCVWTPKPLNRWRLAWLRLFGARLAGNPFVHQRARIAIPWNLTMYDKACLGDRTNAYSLGPIEIHERVTVAQEAYLCAGTHDFSDPTLPLQTGRIVLEQDTFIGARAFVLPGVTVMRGAIIGACAVVTKDVPPNEIVAGNPARRIGMRGSTKVAAESPI